MPIEDFIITVFCYVTDFSRQVSNGCLLRCRGFNPKLSDEEVITMEVVGEFLGIDTDKGIWSYFARHWHDWFPNLGSRANFAKQASNLWAIKQKVQKNIAREVNAFSDNIHLVDGFPMLVCKFRRANKCRIFKGEANYGYCASKDEKYYGFSGHVVVSFSGAISRITVTAANASEREALREMIGPIEGLLIGDKGYISGTLKEELQVYENIQLETPLRRNMKDKRSPAIVKQLMSIRRLIETVIGQLSERFHIEKVWARDLWHLTNRIVRKVMAHTIGVLLNKQLGREPLRFDGLIEI